MCDIPIFFEYSLWWPRWDKKEAFENFESFGGWGRPHMKQFNNETEVCCVTADLNWMPDNEA